jgi:predicted dehydrogenase
MSNDLRLAVIGCGDIANLRYLSSIEYVQGARFVAMCDIVEKKALDACNRVGAEKHFTSHSALLEYGDFDAAIITVPHKLHASIAVDCLRAKKDVLVEKPIATNFSDAKKIVAAATTAKCVFFPMPYDFSPEYRVIEKLIRNEALGEISQAWLHISHAGPTHTDWFFSKEIAERGVLADLGIYPITMILSLMGKATSVYASIGRSRNSRTLDDGRIMTVGVEDTATIVLEFGGSAKTAVISTDWCTGVPKDNAVYEMKIFGTKGFLFADLIGRQVAVFVNDKTYSGGKESDLHGLKMHNLEIPEVPQSIRKNWDGPTILNDFVEALKTRKSDIRWDSALLGIRVMSEAYESSAEGSKRTLEDLQ